MINHILSAIRNELNDFIKIKDPTNFGNLDTVVMSNLVGQDGNLAFTTGVGNNNGNASEHKIVITLVNVEEERVFKEQNYFKKSPEDSIISLNPEVRVNLSVLFTAYSTSYDTSLRLLGYLLGFFQMKNVFTPNNTPELKNHIKKASVELQTLSAEQNNHLWGYLGAKYMPSSVYRIKMLVIQEGQKKMEGPPISIIDEKFEDKTA